MPTHAEALNGWLITAILLGWLIWRLRSGAVWAGVYGVIRKTERPGLFWFAIAVHGLLIFVIAFMSAYASVSLPNEAETGVR